MGKFKLARAKQLTEECMIIGNIAKLHFPLLFSVTVCQYLEMDDLHWKKEDEEWCLYKGEIYLARLIPQDEGYMTDIDEPLAEWGCSIVDVATVKAGKVFLENWARIANLV